MIRRRIRTYRLSKGKEQETLYLESADERQTHLPDNLKAWTARVGNSSFDLNIPGPSYKSTEPEPFEVFATLRPSGFRLEVCATCSHFRFSGLTRDWSGGSRGYCLLEPQTATGWPKVGVDYYCGDHNFVAENDTRYL